MQTMTKAALESACGKTVDEWDMQTLVQFAIDSMLEIALSVSPVYVVISDNGAFHASADTEADAVYDFSLLYFCLVDFSGIVTFS